MKRCAAAKYFAVDVLISYYFPFPFHALAFRHELSFLLKRSGGTPECFAVDVLMYYPFRLLCF